jgi:hypothetical protein
MCGCHVAAEYGPELLAACELVDWTDPEIIYTLGTTAVAAIQNAIARSKGETHVQ